MERDVFSFSTLFLLVYTIINSGNNLMRALTTIAVNLYLAIQARVCSIVKTVLNYNNPFYIKKKHHYYSSWWLVLYWYIHKLAS